MKALTVQQPWAWAIVHGGKDVENRTQAWSHRGPLAIHAGNRWSDRGGRSWPILRHPDYADAEMHKGSVIGVADLVGAHTAHEGCCESEWGEQAYDEHGGRRRRDIVHLELEHARALPEPVPCRGALGLWTLPVEVRDAVLEQLVEATA